ncbi:hypothetical protein NQ318_021688 [Aromia moschata]|uniref:Uncharacterized protein n=1 Tax=Aromia moschata TaxID=1265417 RepID=A0AAV8YEB7_9CUCU|nr:hypothetical protein NQ318_021688 [Aromia moschata]
MPEKIPNMRMNCSRICRQLLNNLEKQSNSKENNLQKRYSQITKYKSILTVSLWFDGFGQLFDLGNGILKTLVQTLSISPWLFFTWKVEDKYKLAVQNGKEGLSQDILQVESDRSTYRSLPTEIILGISFKGAGHIVDDILGIGGEFLQLGLLGSLLTFRLSQNSLKNTRVTVSKRVWKDINDPHVGF